MTPAHMPTGGFKQFRQIIFFLISIPDYFHLWYGKLSGAKSSIFLWFNQVVVSMPGGEGGQGKRGGGGTKSFLQSGGKGQEAQ